MHNNQKNKNKENYFTNPDRIISHSIMRLSNSLDYFIFAMSPQGKVCVNTLCNFE